MIGEDLRADRRQEAATATADRALKDERDLDPDLGRLARTRMHLRLLPRRFTRTPEVEAEAGLGLGLREIGQDLGRDRGQTRRQDLENLIALLVRARRVAASLRTMATSLILPLTSPQR